MENSNKLPKRSNPIIFKKGELNKMKLFLTLILFLPLLVLAEGGKNKNPMESTTLEDGCVLVFADGIDEDECVDLGAPPQSGKQYICEVLMVCGSDTEDDD